MKYLHTYIELTLRKLKDLKGKSDWEIKMSSRNRKTLAVCTVCHQKIHSGKLD